MRVSLYHFTTHINTMFYVIYTMLHLPKELIDLIYEYEGNHYYKKANDTTIKELMTMVHTQICGELFECTHYAYKVYFEYNMTDRPKLTFGQYMLYIDKLRKKATFNPSGSFSQMVFRYKKSCIKR